ncbi:thiol reductant ABC exporter subunit CydD [Virgibacillus sp. C22-A2]|uniref:Thiol reductant ABC exporter subunit CydD n=1 Tax=Virgibacillus tibetensis TaxID=3042313 RepID=A0ABU6KES5_9BACI|nr:thiol reductant ABC exporter subunit CydD [Virgibacillus sp. C22-A2]
MVQLKELAYEQKNKLVLLVVFALLSGLILVGQAYFFVSIVDRVFLKKDSFSEIMPLLMGLLLVLFARAAVHYISGRTGVKLASKVKGNLRKSLLNKFSRNPMQASIQGQSGQKVSVMMDAVDEIDSYFSSYIPQIIHSSIVPIIILIVIFTQHMYTGFIILITAPFIPVFMIVIGMKTKDKSEAQMDKMAAFSGQFLDTLQGLTTLKLFGRATIQKEKIRKSSLGFRDATMEVLKIAFSSSFMLELVSMLSMGLIALEVSIRLIVFDNISFFTAFLMLVLAPEFYVALKDLGSAFHTGRGSMGAAKKIEAELTETDLPVSWGDREVEGKPPSLLLNGVTFRYGEDSFSLRNIHAEVAAYEKVAVVGKSGAGKTTLLHVIAGLVPLSEGELLINRESRSDYREKSWYDQLSYISQNPYLFSGTIAENIAIGGRENATRNEIEHAAEKAGISHLVESLEKGYDTPVGEAGRGLSGGEKQRIALARAFLKSPSMILFDEPTTGLDLHTERILQSSIKELSQSATVITVAHRLHTIKNADKILFLENGELLASGTHEELLTTVEAYRTMVSVQQGGNVS